MSLCHQTAPTHLAPPHYCKHALLVEMICVIKSDRQSDDVLFGMDAVCFIFPDDNEENDCSAQNNQSFI